MINRYITAAILVTTLLCSHRANAELIRVSDGEMVNDLASETTTVWDIDDNGNLKGAFNVTVAGTLWDVVFQDGTFGSVFPDAATIDNRSYEVAMELATALDSSVFMDIATSGYMFDSYPEFTRGCMRIELCHVITPYGGGDADRMVGALTVNFSSLYLIDDGVGLVGLPWELDLSDNPNTVFARWNQQVISEVPSPSTISIFALGIMGLASRRFKKQS